PLHQRRKGGRQVLVRYGRRFALDQPLAAALSDAYEETCAALHVIRSTACARAGRVDAHVQLGEAVGLVAEAVVPGVPPVDVGQRARPLDRKSTRLNSSHVAISYAVFCLKKKKNHNT